MRMIGVDIGGTFTDIVLTDTAAKRIVIHKVPTTADDPSRGMVSGIIEVCRRHAIAAASIDHVLHGTTIATNSVLEHKGARVGVITSRGFRDILHIGRHQRPQHYSIMQEIPWQDRPLAPRRWRKVVDERITPPKGEVLLPLDESQVRAAARELKGDAVEAIAICFLFSYIDPTHEDRAAAIVREEYPQAFVTTSASVSPQFREFERFTTAAMNAFIGPKVRDYVSNLARALGRSGFKADLHVMASNGGVATAEMVVDKPVLTLLSGPAAGVLGGAWAGALSGRKRLITFDIGGTSADIGLVDHGVYSEATARDTWIAGFPALVPMIDVHTIGAGGGSIARVDAAGGFFVGPQSAGAAPGPAAYGRGGTMPTVTDANIVLGRLDPDNFLGGEMKLDPAASHRVIGQLAEQLKLPPLEAAAGVVTVLNSYMANAFRARTVQKGSDPRGFARVPVGGAGPLHGADVAAMLEIPEVIVPPYPGITSAIGLLTTDLKYDAIKTAFQVKGAIDSDRLRRDFAEMESRLAAQFRAAGVAAKDVAFARAGDLRDVGQGYELRVPFPAGVLSPAKLDAVWAKFHQQHRAEYGHHFEDSPIEIVNIRVTGVGAMAKIGKPPAPASGTLDRARLRAGRGVFRVNGRLKELDTVFYRRNQLPLDRPFDGPCIVLQTDSTTVVPPQCRAVADRFGNLILTVGGPARRAVTRPGYAPSSKTPSPAGSKSANLNRQPQRRRGAEKVDHKDRKGHEEE